MKKKTANKLLLTLAAASFLIAVLEGTIYYAQYEKTWFFEWLLILQNAVKAFLFTPNLTAEKVLSSLQGDTAGWQYAVGCAYVAAVFIAPLCTATALFRAVERLLRRGALRLRGRDAALVYGWDPTVETMLLKRENGAGQVWLIPGRPLPEEKQLALLRHGVSTCREGEEARMWAKARAIFLLDPSSARNLSTYVRLQRWWQTGARRGAAPKVVCACEEEGVRTLTIALHDRSGETGGGALPVALYSMAELKVRAALEAHPLWEYNFSEGFRGDEETRYDVHMLLVGFGQIGRQLLEQAISLSALSSDSQITFDVVDRDARRLLRFFEGRFAPDYVRVDREEGTLSIPSDHADGSLTVRFHQMDVDDGGFQALLREVDARRPLTYAAVCLEDPDTAVRCLFALDQVLREDDRPIPVAVRMELSREVAGQLRHSGIFHGQVFPFCCETDALTLEYLAGEEAYAGAMRFNCEYNNWSEILSGNTPAPSDPEEAWRALPYFKQASSLAQYQHQGAKRARLAFEKTRPGGDGPADPAELALLGEPPLTGALAVEFARLEHRRWCYYMATVGWGWGKEKDEAGRRNPCMTPWEALRRTRPWMCLYDTTPYRMLIGETAPRKTEPGAPV